MANLTPSAAWDDVYQFETTDPILGGAGGIDNRPHQELLNRTEYLRGRLDTVAARNAQARSNVVLSGQSNSTTGVFDALTIAASNTLRLQASVGSPFIYSASGGYDENGEITTVKKVTSNVDISTSSLANGNYLAIVLHDNIGGAPELFYVQESGFYATPFQPTPSGVSFNLWFNTATGISYLDNFRTAGAWNAFNIVVVGRFTKSGGNLATVETFPYRQPFYDEETVSGTMLAYASVNTPRGGWLFCDGSAVSRNRYRKLFTAIGTTYGAGDGSTTFNLPDLRGYFVRGWDAGAGVDAGRVFGTTQTDEFESHTHTFTDYASNTRTAVLADTGGTGGDISLPNAGTTFASDAAMDASGGANETRPKNVAMGYWIKW